MTQTQKRIKAYQAMLPGLKERVLAVALLLVVSLTMMTSATFAWLTISRAPEVTGVSTTVAANGNLEIALATSETAPGDSQVGDSSAAEGQSVVEANITWGNLVNLSDPSYGLDNLVLRPAQLNTTALLTSPLYGAVYSEDGRIERLTSNFSYTSWVMPTDDLDGYFGLSNNLGVRAVSSTKREMQGFQGTYLNMKDVATGLNIDAGNAFAAITQNDAWMTVLAKLMGIHMTATLNYEDKYINAVVSDEDLGTLIAMYDAFIVAHEKEALAIADQLNLQLYLAYGGDTSKYAAYTDKAVLAISDFDANGDFVRKITVEKDGTTTEKTIKIIGMKQFIADYNMLVADVAEITSIRDGDDGRWTASGLKKLVNKLVDINKCLVKKTSDSTYKTVSALLSEFQSSPTTALGYRNSTCDVIITNGVFMNFEQRTGGEIAIQKLPITATMYVNTMNLGEVSATIYANITTSATKPSQYDQDTTYADTLNTGADNSSGTVMAQDTYALAVDLWVRTNAQGSYLTLEGNVLTEDEEVRATGKDANGNTVELFTLTRSETVDGNAYTDSYTLYQVAVKEGEAKPVAWYNAEANALGEYVALSEADVNNLQAANKTVTGKDGQTYSVSTLTRNESKYEENTYTLYKVETTVEGVTTTAWYNDEDNSEFVLEAGEVPTETEETRSDGTTKLYTLTRVTTTTESVTYELYQKEIDTTWYNAATYNVFNLNDGETPTAKMETITTVIGFEGENRVWDTTNKTYISTDATTQGSGSCYVYYADTPEDQARSLELLAAMNVAFINEDGALLATAGMDTASYFAESGRVIVPLVLESGGVYLGDDDNGNAMYAITGLEKNVATRITALVYLDGTLLGNDNVLAASDIQGQLNIQFGSSLELHPIDNEDLENKELRVSAAVDKTTFDYDTATEPMKVNVTVNVDGDQPNTVTAFFLRRISSTQGSREEKMTFTKNAAGDWVADYTFDSPGDYILRSVQLDGVDYPLGTMPTVTISGFTVSSLEMSGDGVEGSSHANIMTAANSATVDLKLKFATNDPTKMPGTVQGRFLREDGTAVNVNFTYDPTTQLWSGSATFLSSGDYTFEYLVLDGEYEQLDEGLHKTATVTLGMRVAVYTTSPVSFKYLPSEMTDNQKLLGMQVKIMDNTGKELEGLQGAKLVYSMQGSIATMDTDLTWNAAQGYYIGALKALESGGPGTWRFSSVTVSGNSLTNATESPTFNLISPEPPSFVDLDDGRTLAQAASGEPAYRFAPNGDAVLNARIKYSATATVQALIVDEDGNEYEVQGSLITTEDNITTWHFAIPKNEGGSYSGKQDNYWTMKEIRIWNYFKTDGTYVSAELGEDKITLKPDGERDDPMVITEEELKASDSLNGLDYETKVVQTVNVTFADNQSKDFGVDANGNKTGAFMTSYTISGLNVEIKDFEGKAISGVKDVKLEYIYQNDSAAKGGYTSASLTNAVADFEITLTDDGSGTKFVQSGTKSIQYAGTYIPKFSFTLGSSYSYGDGKTMDGMPANTPKFTVSSVTPIVYISDITLDGGAAYSVDLNTTGSLADSSTYITQDSGCLKDYIYTCTTHKNHIYAANNTQYISRIEDSGRAAWLYFKCSHSDVATYNGGRQNGGDWGADFEGHTYSYNNGEGVPKATLKLSGMGNATAAVLTFAKTGGGDVIMITQYTADRTGGTYWGDYSTYGTDKYEWSADGDCVRFIGVMDNGAGDNESDTKTVAGTITASTLVMTYNNVEYSFTIPTITINNPY